MRPCTKSNPMAPAISCRKVPLVSNFLHGGAAGVEFPAQRCLWCQISFIEVPLVSERCLWCQVLRCTRDVHAAHREVEPNAPRDLLHQEYTRGFTTCCPVNSEHFRSPKPESGFGFRNKTFKAFNLSIRPHERPIAPAISCHRVNCGHFTHVHHESATFGKQSFNSGGKWLFPLARTRTRWHPRFPAERCLWCQR